MHFSSAMMPILNVKVENNEQDSLTRKISWPLSKHKDDPEAKQASGHQMTRLVATR